MYIYGNWMHIRVFWSVQALHGATNALYWKCFKRQNSTHMTPVKHQNTKTSLYKLTKNYWVITLFEILGSVRRDLQSTVSFDHPVIHVFQTHFLVLYRSFFFKRSPFSCKSDATTQSLEESGFCKTEHQRMKVLI